MSTALAFITEWLRAWGPIGYFIALSGGCLIASVVYCLGAIGYSRIVLSRRTNAILERSNVNPLNDNFERQVIRLIDFYHPLMVPRENQTFRKCEITGPGLVLFEGLNATGGSFRNVQIAIVRADKPLWGLTIFKNATLIDCLISNITMLMTRETYNGLPPDMKLHVPIISEITQA